MSGSLTFTASGVYAKVTANYSNDGSSTTKIGEKTFDSSNQGTEEWNDKNIAFNPDGHDVVLTLTIQNLATDRDLYAKVIDNSGTITNINKTLEKDSSTYISGKEVTIAKGGTNTTTITITFGLADKNTSLSDATYSYAIELNNESVGDTVEKLYYEENGTYYVKMGTYDNTDVIWKCYGYTDDTEVSSYNTTSGKYGIFVQETKTTTSIFGSDKTYMGSTIETYLVNSYQSVLGISNNDYAQIIARNDGENMTAANDKFWLLSNSEFSTLVNNGDFGTAFWLRSFPSPNYNDCMSCASTNNMDGSYVNFDYITSALAVRAAFLLEI
jgi:hypothetical protein